MAVEEFYLSKVRLAQFDGRHEGCGFEARQVDVKVTETNSFGTFGVAVKAGRVSCSGCKLAGSEALNTKIGGRVRADAVDGPSIAAVNAEVGRMMGVAFPCEHPAQAQMAEQPLES